MNIWPIHTLTAFDVARVGVFLAVDEVGQHVLVAPSLAAQLLPLIKIQATASQVRQVVNTA